MGNNKNEKWIIVGTGEISDRFAKMLKMLEQTIVGVVGTSVAKAKVFGEKWGIPNRYSDYHHINDVDYQNVYIASPNIFHYDQARHFIELGKNALIEKPMTHQSELTYSLIALAASKGVKIMEAYAHIFPDRLKEYRMKGKVLRTNLMQVSSKIINGTAATASSFRKDRFGGVMPDLGVYTLSLAVWLNGIVTDYTITHHELYNDVEADVTFELTHANGAHTISRVSKLVDGDNAVYLDDILIAKHVSLSNETDRMKHELSIFLSGDYTFSHHISLEVARIIDCFKNDLKTR